MYLVIERFQVKFIVLLSPNFMKVLEGVSPLLIFGFQSLQNDWDSYVRIAFKTVNYVLCLLSVKPPDCTMVNGWRIAPCAKF